MVLEVTIDVGFDGPFSVYSNCDKYRLLLYTSVTMTNVGLGFGFTGLVGCGIYIEVLLQKGILSSRFLHLY